MLEGAQKFDPSKAPLFADAKGVFRLAYGSFTQGDTSATAARATIGTMMLDAIYNVDKQWYVAFRYSTQDVDVDGLAAAVDFGNTTRMSIGGGCRLTDKSILKLDYTTNTEEDSAVNPKLDNDSVSLLMTVLW